MAPPRAGGQNAQQDPKASVVLLIGDERDRIEELERVLRAQGANTGSGRVSELMALTRKSSPDLIVLVGSAAAGGGARASEELRASPQGCATPYVTWGSLGADLSPSRESHFGWVEHYDAEISARELGRLLLRFVPTLEGRSGRPHGEVGLDDLPAHLARLREAGRAGLLVVHGGAGGAASAVIGKEENGSADAQAPAEGDFLKEVRALEDPRKLRWELLEITSLHLSIVREDDGQSGSPKLSGMRVLVVDPNTDRRVRVSSALSAAGAGAFDCPPVLPALEKLRGRDPVVAVVASEVLSGDIDPIRFLFGDPRLSTTNFLVVDWDGVTSDEERGRVEASLPRWVARRGAVEIATQSRIISGKPFFERLHTLGPARWLKALGKSKDPVAMSARSASGVADLELAGGRLKGARYQPFKAGAKEVLGKAALQAFLRMRSARVTVFDPAEYQSAPQPAPQPAPAPKRRKRTLLGSAPVPRQPAPANDRPPVFEDDEDSTSVYNASNLKDIIAKARQLDPEEKPKPAPKLSSPISALAKKSDPPASSEPDEEEGGGLPDWDDDDMVETQVASREETQKAAEEAEAALLAEAELLAEAAKLSPRARPTAPLSALTEAARKAAEKGSQDEDDIEAVQAVEASAAEASAAATDALAAAAAAASGEEEEEEGGAEGLFAPLGSLPAGGGLDLSAPLPEAAEEPAAAAAPVAAKEAEKEGGSKVGLIVGVIVLLLALAGGAYYFMRGGGSGGTDPGEGAGHPPTTEPGTDPGAGEGEGAEGTEGEGAEGEGAEGTEGEGAEGEGEDPGANDPEEETEPPESDAPPPANTDTSAVPAFLRFTEDQYASAPSLSELAQQMSDARRAERALNMRREARDAFRARSWSDAEMIYRQSLFFEPESGAAAYGIAINLLRQRRNDQALLWARRAVHYEPRNPRYLMLLGDVHSALNQLTTARDIWLEVLRLEPDHRFAHERMDYLRDHGVDGVPPAPTE